jgi:putative oxidoreductase
MRFLIRIADGLNELRDIPPLLFRLLLAFGFYGTFMMKAQSPSGFAGYLGSLGVPAPEFWAWVTMICEGAGVICLFFGFLTRIITIPLIIIMINAIALVHWSHGYNPGANGFAIPLIYGLMLISLLITGPGRVSVDALFAGPARRKMGGGGSPQK